MKGILADHNIEGHLARLVPIWEGPFWRELWASLSLTVYTFEKLTLDTGVEDPVLWHLCQQRDIVLVTANRNADGPTSLETTIRTFNQPNHLPVLTIADADRVVREATYAHRVADKLVDYLFIIDQVRGAGRLYVP